MTTIFDSYSELKDSYHQIMAEITILCEDWLSINSEKLRNGCFCQLNHWHYHKDSDGQDTVTIFYTYQFSENEKRYAHVIVPVEELV